MPKLRVYRVPTAITIGAQKPYAGDDSEVFETSNVYASKKTLRFIKHPNLYDPSSFKVGCELKATAGSYDLGVFLDGGSAITIQGTDTSYALKINSYGLGAVSAGIHTLDFRLRNSGPGSSFLHLTDLILID